MQGKLRFAGLLCATFLLANCGGDGIAGPTADSGTVPWGEDDDNDTDPWLDAGPSADAELIDDVEDVEEFDAAEPIEDDAGEPVVVDSGRVDSGTRVDASIPPACTPRTYRLRHLQASMEHFDPAAQLNSSIDTAFGAGAHSISWTEIETITQVRRIAGRNGWATYWPSGRAEVAAKNAVPVSWRTDTFRLVRGQSWLASEGLAGVSPSRWVTRVWLTHIASGRVVSRVAHHSVSGVDGAGKDPVAWRRRMHALDIAKFKAVMLLDTVPVVGSADFNTTRLRTLLGSGFLYDVPSSGGSHGSRLIDWIVRRPNSQMRLVSSEFVSLGASDHRGVRATYDYTPPCR